MDSRMGIRYLFSTDLFHYIKTHNHSFCENKSLFPSEVWSFYHEYFIYRFEVDGISYIIRFVEAFQKTVINGVAFIVSIINFFLSDGNLC